MMGEEGRVQDLLRTLDLRLEPEGWHRDAHSQLWYIRETTFGRRLRAQRANLPSIDDHPDLTPAQVLYELAKRIGYTYPVDTVGVAFSAEAHGVYLDKNAGVGERDQFLTARRRREFHRLPGARETRLICLVLRDGTEALLAHLRDGEVQCRVGPQGGLTFQALRLLLGLPEDDQVETPANEWAE